MPIKDDAPHLRIRLEPQLLQRLEKAREQSGRTLTGEITERLKESFRKEDTASLITKTVEASATAFKDLLPLPPGLRLERTPNGEYRLVDVEKKGSKS